MKLLFYSFLLGLFYAASSSDLPNGGKRWALLVASSKGYHNYRHQADICHAYQLLRANGIADENIIVMMYDDIAYNVMNPLPGVVRNAVGGPNLYTGVPKDYTGTSVTKSNFLKVLSGDSAGMEGIGSGRVLVSGPDDHVFVNIVDHGAPLVLAFPDTTLYADELVDTLHAMADQGKFGKLVLYVEACEAGSMFQNMLDSNRSIYVTTASNAHEPSYSCCYDEEVGMLVGDEYSVNWMQHSEKVDLSSETLFSQFEQVRNVTKGSHVTEYGDRGLRDDFLTEFFGTASIEGGTSTKKPPRALSDVVSSRDAQFEALKKKLAVSGPGGSFLIHQKLKRISESREELKHVVQEIVKQVSEDDAERYARLMHQKTSPASRSSLPCYKNLVQQFDKHCKSLSEQEEDVLSYFYVLLNICDENFKENEKIEKIIEGVCQKSTGLRYLHEEGEVKMFVG